MPNGARMGMMSRKILNTPIDGKSAQPGGKKRVKWGLRPFSFALWRLLFYHYNHYNWKGNSAPTKISFFAR